MQLSIAMRLALMVVDQEGMVLASSAMALRSFQPPESDPPLNFSLPFISIGDLDIDPREAQVALQAHRATFDLLATDHNMLGYSGIDLFCEAKTVRSSLPVAFASGYVTSESDIGQ
jgi:CheY-like chemotaxis protein